MINCCRLTRKTKPETGEIVFENSLRTRSVHIYQNYRLRLSKASRSSNQRSGCDFLTVIDRRCSTTINCSDDAFLLLKKILINLFLFYTDKRISRRSRFNLVENFRIYYNKQRPILRARILTISWKEIFKDIVVNGFKQYFLVCHQSF